MAQVIAGTSDPTQPFSNLGIAFLVACFFWLFTRWLLRAPSRPDPWDEQVAAKLEGDEATPLCHRCLTPHDAGQDFCQDCGAPVGHCTNWLPFPYLFPIGHMLRIGTSGDFKRSPLTMAGFFLVGFAEYSIFAPVYWFVFLRNCFRRARERPDQPMKL